MDASGWLKEFQLTTRHPALRSIYPGSRSVHPDSTTSQSPTIVSGTGSSPSTDRVYDFRMRPLVPKRLSKEALLVDLLHNLDQLPEDKSAVLSRPLKRAKEMDPARLTKAVQDFGSARAERLLAPVP